MQNFVAKHARTFNKATVQRDRTKFQRNKGNDLMSAMDEWEDNEEDWGLQDAITMEEDWGWAWTWGDDELANLEDDESPPPY